MFGVGPIRSCTSAATSSWAIRSAASASSTTGACRRCSTSTRASSSTRPREPRRLVPLGEAGD
jgi:hypothetical protein